MKPQARQALTIASCFAVALAIGLFAVHASMQRLNEPALQKWNQIHIGDDESHVTKLLGPPLRRHAPPEAPHDYRVSGYGQPTREIGHGVLIYMGGDMILYLWLDQNGRVEKMFRAHS